MNISDPIIGQKLGDYTILELLGKGGMARVYKGYDEALDRYAAVKVITSDFVATADELEYQERFQREARAIARLRHPHIVGVYQFGHLETLYYMAMVFLDGEDLRVTLKKYAERNQTMPHDDILKMARDVASALDYAHGQGVIHRDIKPSNIMMTSTGATLTDFGLALNMMEGTAGDTFGSAHYIAPEQAISSARAVAQSDLYSLGVVLYEAFTGRVPFDDPSVMSVALKHLNEPPPRPSEANPTFPKALEDVLLKVLAKEPRDRYQTGADFVAALEKALDLEGDTARIDQSVPRPAVVINPASETSPSVSSVAAPPQLAVPGRKANSQDSDTKSRTPLIIAGVVVVLLLLLFGAFLVVGNGGDEGDDNGNNGDNNAAVATTDAATEIALAASTEIPTEVPTEIVTVEATEVATEGAATEVATEVATEIVTEAPPTATNTPEPTVTSTATPTASLTPTDTPTATLTRTSEPTATATLTETPTHTPTDTLAPTESSTPTLTVSPTTAATELLVPTVENPQFELRYTDGSIILENISNQRLNISSLTMSGDTIGFFRATDWNDSLTPVNGSLASFASGGCVQLVIERDARLNTSCRFYNTWILNESLGVYFWSSENATFEVRLNNTVVGLCLTSAGLCQFDLLPLTIPEPNATSSADDSDSATSATSDLILRYNNMSFLMFILGTQPLDLSDLNFVGDQNGSFASTSWQRALSNISRDLSSITAGGCLQIVTRVDAVQEADCELYNIWLLRGNSDAHFWFDVSDNTTFEVRLGDNTVATCSVATSGAEQTCNISIPIS